MDFDFIVVGAGIAGCSLAHELARSARVCVLESESRPGLHATSRSAALFAASYGGPEIRAITRASRAFFDSPPGGFSDQPLLVKRGCLYIARADQGVRLGRMVAGIRASGGSVSVISAQEALGFVPLLRRDYLSGAALDSDAMDIDVHALQQGFLRGARAAGTVLMTNSKIGRVARRSGMWSVALNDGVVSAPVLVNAAGAWADEVAELCGAQPIGLQPLRRTALLVDAPVGLDIRSWPAVIDVDEMFYFKPDANRLLVSPADETPQSPGDAQPEEMDIAVGVDRVQAALDIEVRRVSHSWAGLRTFSPDRVPVLGFDPQVAGLFWCAGQGGYGIQTAPAMARMAAALLKHESLPADIAAEGLRAADLSPLRFMEMPALNRRGNE
jgi:D-arginine dehydrogenase